MATRNLSRREAIRLAMLGVAGTAIAACAPAPTPAPPPTKAPAPAAPAPTQAPAAAPKPAAAPTATPAPAPATPTPAPAKPTAAAKPATAPKIKIEYLGYVDDLHKEAWSVFEKANPNIELEKSVVVGGWLDILAKISSRLAAGNPPDLISVPTYGQYITWGRKGLLLQLDDYVKADKEFGTEAIPKKVLDGYRVDTKLYGIPKDYVAWGLFYNVDLFQKAGIKPPDDTWTWKDVVEKGAILKKEAGEKTVFSYLTPMGQGNAEGWLWQNGGPGFFDREKPNVDWQTPTINHPKNVEALQWLADTVLKYKLAPGPEALKTEASTPRMLTGRLSMWPGTTINTVELLKNEDKLNWMVTHLPLAYQGGPRATMTWTSGAAIVAKTKYKDECFAFLKSMSIGEGVVVLGRSGFSIPAGVKQVGAFLSDKMKRHGGQVFLDASQKYDIVQNDRLGPHHVQLLNTAITPNMEAIFLGRKAVADAVKEMQAGMEEIVRKPED
ncbi:MAG: sugar ABC transporter substrate-binding protein [Chloroflexi bacterium]|nr:sugar ABC transporter substrate-binding protein [Chloroflexota bacterium]